MQQLHQGGQQFHQQNTWNNNGPSGYPPQQVYGDSSNGASTVDDLIAGAGREPDEVDEAIRLAIAGVKPPPKVETAPLMAAPVAAIEVPTVPQPLNQTAPVETVKADATEKKTKKDKAIKMVYSDNEISPEERMAKFARYAFVPEIQA
jgi:hypothetical protein